MDYQIKSYKPDLEALGIEKPEPMPRTYKKDWSRVLDKWIDIIFVCWFVTTILSIVIEYVNAK